MPRAVLPPPRFPQPRGAFDPVEVLMLREGRGLLAGRLVAAVRLAVLPDRWGQALGAMTPEVFSASRLGTGEPGEILVSGSHVLDGYLDGRGDEATKVRVGEAVWHRTGDAGYLDDEGRLWLLGRCAARISDERGSIYPFAVEGAISDVPKVRRAALVGHQGRRILLLEVRGASEALLAHIDLRWAQLDTICYVRSLPVDRRHNAKIDYPALRKLVDRGGV